MKLKPQFMLVTALVFIVTAGAVSWLVRTLAEGIIEQWAPRYITKQTLYDKSRTLQPILRELALSRQLATSNTIKQWAHSPQNESLQTIALDELENYRQNFQDKSYFVALLSNGHYYHNNAQNEFRGKEFRYVLDESKQEDSWFYNLIEQKRDIHINVNPDVELGITKLWIDVLIKDGDEILGMVGTGLDLTTFLNSVVEEVEPGIHSFFIDHVGAIQLHRDKAMIDFGSVTKTKGTHKTIDLIFDNKNDLESIYQSMRELESGDKQVATTFVDLQGSRQLVGLVYLPEIDWYEITLIDLNIFLPISHFTKIVLVFIGTLLIALTLMNLVLTRLVLNPISELDKALALFEKGKNPKSEITIRRRGELGRVTYHFIQMAESALQSKRDLERKVHERTAELERLTQIDPLTELYNRRGMAEQIEASLNRAEREDLPLGLLWIDIDWFKDINDTYGHAAGDESLKAIAEVIKQTIRSYDMAARWGGDEFLVLLVNVDANELVQLAGRLCSQISRHQFSNRFSISVSIGGAMYVKGQNIDTWLQNADQALYKAKDNGRNGFYINQVKAIDNNESSV
ncbi:diguanylate cyclase [Vibrio sp. Y2-5]|uniref:GGDEF domain-containing protein n=1 Tax=Vibrio sp. Y2-5 TaxID=2743977 RepID=UPI0016605C9B|nr:GGDEF domain-containing protein [Vibrio sp. Y2-5]MBD0786299.1 diguanylate cyclase [Vibrio sp. Y2-5]